MSSKSCFEIAFILGLIFVCTNAEDRVFNVHSYGAKADGITDDSKVRSNHFTFQCVISYYQFIWVIKPKRSTK